MNRQILFIALSGVFAASYAQMATITSSSSLSSDNGYELVWSEEFNKEGDVDTTVWNFEEGFVRNHEDQWYRQNNAFCKDVHATGVLSVNV